MTHKDDKNWAPPDYQGGSASITNRGSKLSLSLSFSLSLFLSFSLSLFPPFSLSFLTCDRNKMKKKKRKKEKKNDKKNWERGAFPAI